MIKFNAKIKTSVIEKNKQKVYLLTLFHHTTLKSLIIMIYYSSNTI